MSAPYPFVDRLAVETYADDEPVRVFSPETETEAWVPERLFERLQALAKGYQLHVATLVAEQGLSFLNVAQAQNFGDELAFLGDVTNDPALHEQIKAISAVVSDGANRASKAAVGFDWP
jgi:hypothetical protein